MNDLEVKTNGTAGDLRICVGREEPAIDSQ